MTLSQSSRPFSRLAIMTLVGFTAMCGKEDAAKIKLHPSSPDDRGAAGEDSGSLGAAGENAAGSGGSGGSSGTSNGQVNGSSGGTSAGEGGVGASDSTGGT